MHERVSVYLGASEGERETVFKINFIFLSLKIGGPDLAAMDRKLLIFLIFADKVLSSLSRFLSFSCLLSLSCPNPICLSETDKNVYLFDFLTVFVLSGSV